MSSNKNKRDLPFPLTGPTNIEDVLVESGLAKHSHEARNLLKGRKVHVILDCVSPKVLVEVNDPSFKVNPAFRYGEER